MPGPDNHWPFRRQRRIRKLGLQHLPRFRLRHVAVLGWEGCGPFDLIHVELQPLALVKADRSHRATVLAIERDEAPLVGRSLHDDHLLAEGRHPYRLDADAELERPEGRYMEVRASLGFGVQHVVCRDLGLLNRVAPMLEGQELEPEHWMRRTGYVARGEDVVGDDAVHVEDATSGIAGDAPRARAETRVAQPLGVALGAERDHGHVDLECGPVIQVGAAHVSGIVALQ